MKQITCQYCDQPPKLVGGDIIYPHRPDLKDLNFWLCQRCQAYVGCHKGTVTPFGILADAELRKLKSKLHIEFDVLWRGRNRIMSRYSAYKWLAKKLVMPMEFCHIGMFDNETCKKAIQIIKNL